MDIKISHNWLKKVLKTNATVEDIAKFVSLCGPAVERIHKVNGDQLMNVEITSNRPDAFSVYGFAREAFAILPRFKKNASLIEPEGLKTSLVRDSQKNLRLKVLLQNKKLCSRFTAIILEDVQIKQSPKEIKDFLENSQIRSLNNVIDITNLIMLELGQPMHAFDYDSLLNQAMILRESKEGESVVTIDGTLRKLPKGAIVIEDKDRLIDLCGIMGGQNSQITKKTKRVVFFVQIYDPVKIRKTSNAINLRTEASTRFEKGLDPEGVLPALKRAVFLAKKLAGAKIASELIDIYPIPYKTKTLTLTRRKLDLISGVQIPSNKVVSILESLGLKTKIKKSRFEVQIPSFRADDIDIEEDLIEEVTRLYGYFNLPPTLPTGQIPQDPVESVFKWENKVKNLLKGLGFIEIYSYSMVPRKYINPNLAIKIKNPLTVDLEFLRTSILPQLVEVATQNEDFAKNGKYFEIANVYQAQAKGLPKENLRLTAVLQNSNFAKTKGVLIAILNELGIIDFEIEIVKTEMFDSAASIIKRRQIMGTFGKLEGQNYFGIDLDFSKLNLFATIKKSFQPVPKFPPVLEDISLIVDQETPVAKIEQLAKKMGGRLVREVETTDVFLDPKLGKNKKSVTISITYQHPQKTLKSQEILYARNKIIDALERNLNAQIRK